MQRDFWLKPQAPNCLGRSQRLAAGSSPFLSGCSVCRAKEYAQGGVSAGASSASQSNACSPASRCDHVPRLQRVGVLGWGWNPSSAPTPSRGPRRVVCSGGALRSCCWGSYLLLHTRTRPAIGDPWCAATVRCHVARTFADALAALQLPLRLQAQARSPRWGSVPDHRTSGG
jgi:hypothetical protein